MKIDGKDVGAVGDEITVHAGPFAVKVIDPDDVLRGISGPCTVTVPPGGRAILGYGITPRYWLGLFVIHFLLLLVLIGFPVVAGHYRLLSEDTESSLFPFFMMTLVWGTVCFPSGVMAMDSRLVILDAGLYRLVFSLFVLPDRLLLAACGLKCPQLWVIRVEEKRRTKTINRIAR